MTDLLQQAINCDDPDQAARIIRDALGIESDDVVNYCFPTTWPTDRERRARLHRRVAQDRGPLSRVVTDPRRFPPPWSVRGNRPSIPAPTAMSTTAGARGIPEVGHPTSKAQNQ
jgi:hypothetical protein